jgi:FkbM family methyltransferase
MDEVNVAFHYLEGKLPKGVMLDVGAHQGGSCLPFLDRGWEVHAFEPSPRNRAVLAELGSRHDGLHIDSRAVSDFQATAVPFYDSQVSSGISSLLPFHESHKQGATVEVTTLAAVCQERSIGRVDFLKIDTEGHDLLVLKGFPWDTITPDVVLCEFEDQKTVGLGYTYEDLGQFLVDRGYAVMVSEWYPISGYGRKHRWRRLFRFPGKTVCAESWGNFIAFRDSVDWAAACDAFAQSALLAETAVREKLEGKLAAIRSTLSWRLTYPLRAAKGILGRLLHRRSADMA